MGSLEQACITGFLCRLCSKMHRSVIHIYGNEGIKLDLERKINNYLPVTVSESDPLPKTVCASCLSRVQSHHELMEKIKKNHFTFTKFRTAAETRRVQMIRARSNQSSSNSTVIETRQVVPESDDEFEHELASIVRDRSRSPLADINALTSNENSGEEEDTDMEEGLITNMFSQNAATTHSDLSTTTDEENTEEEPSEPESE